MGIKEKLHRKLVLGRLLTFTQLSYESLIKCTVFDPCHVCFVILPLHSQILENMFVVLGIPPFTK